MCGRYTLSLSTDAIWEELGLEGEPGADVWSRDEGQGLAPRFNIAPSQAVPVVTDKSPTKLVLLKWGLVPFWAKDPKIGHKLINARAEGVATKPAFRHAFEKRRCLVLADGFYEWKRGETAGKGKKKAGPKTPMYIHFPDGRLMTFAGLWSVWHDPADEENRVLSCTILTTASAQGVKAIHDRMPVILPPEARATWLDRGADARTLESLLHPFTEAPLEIYEVSAAVNSAANQGEALVAPVGPRDDEAEPLLSPD